MPEQIDYEAIAAKHGALPDYDAIAAKYGGIDQNETQPSTFAEKHGVTNPVGRAGLDFLEGFGAGVLSTLHGAEKINPLRVAQNWINKKLGQPELPTLIPKELGQAPPSLAGQAGKFTEQAAEFAIPGSIATKTLRAAPAAARIAGEAALAGGTAGVQTGGDPAAMGTAAATAGLLSGVGAAATSGPGKRVAEYLGEQAREQYLRFLAPTTGPNRNLAQKIVDGLLKRHVWAAGRKGLEKRAAAEVLESGENVNRVWESLPQGTKVPIEPITAELDHAVDVFTLPTEEGLRMALTPQIDNSLKQLGALKRILESTSEVNPATKVREIDVHRLRKLRQAWDEVAATAGVFKGKDYPRWASAKIHELAGNAVREQLAQRFPDVKAVNAEFSFWKNVHDVIHDTVVRQIGQSKPLGQKVAAAGATMVGGQMGGLGGAALGKASGAMFERLVNSGAWQTMSARMKSDLADAIVQQNQGKIQFMLQKALRGAVLETPTSSRSTSQDSAQ